VLVFFVFQFFAISDCQNGRVLQSHAIIDRDEARFLLSAKLLFKLCQISIERIVIKDAPVGANYFLQRNAELVRQASK
jgi:hypothetical protein